MNILISAYHCSPYQGSEYTVGWNWIYQYSRHAGAGDHIFVVANNNCKEAMKKALCEYGLNNVTLWFPKLNKIAEVFLKQRDLIYYTIWQRAAYRFVKQQRISFDIIHHVSKVAWWVPGHFWKYKSAYSIFGPVGGGQEIPDALKVYQRRKSYELFRIIANRTRSLSPWYRKAIETFDVVYVVNEETKKCFSWISNTSKIKIEADIATPKHFINAKIGKTRDNRRHHFLFVGQYDLPRKGALFLLDCLKFLPEGFDYSIDFIGGTDKRKLKEKVEYLKLQDRVTVHGRISYSDMVDVYREYDVFLFPSIRETSGNVLYEAMSNGLPIVGFNTSINRVLNANECGIFIEVEGEVLESIQKAFANAMVDILSRIDYYSDNAYYYANRCTWEEKYNNVMNDYYVLKDSTWDMGV